MEGTQSHAEARTSSLRLRRSLVFLHSEVTKALLANAQTFQVHIRLFPI